MFLKESLFWQGEFRKYYLHDQGSIMKFTCQKGHPWEWVYLIRFHYYWYSLTVIYEWYLATILNTDIILCPYLLEVNYLSSIIGYHKNKFLWLNGGIPSYEKLDLSNCLHDKIILVGRISIFGNRILSGLKLNWLYSFF